MGFLERLEYKKLQKETEAQRQQRNQRKEERQPVIDLESATSQEEKSKRYYEESGCSLLVGKLSEIIGGNIQGYERNGSRPSTRTEEVIDEFKFDLRRNDRERYQLFSDRVFGYLSYKENGFGSHVVFLTWGENERRKGDWTRNCIAIETCPDGEIYFHGGLFGSSVIIKNQWQKDKDCLEKGLEKAYHHPKDKLHAYVPPTTFHSDR